MSKLTKLLKHPILFFKDAQKKRAFRHNNSIDQQDIDNHLIPTYVFGFSPWKSYMTSWFPERKLIFLPKDIKLDIFNNQWKLQIIAQKNAEIFVWGFKVESFVLQFAKRNNINCTYIEDGFIRSIGLGATKTPPFSLTLDTQTPYFDATKESNLEALLNTYDFSSNADLLERAKRLIEVLLETGLSKYNHAAPVAIDEIYGPKTCKRILVIGQVEDDASIRFGCSRGYTNNDAVMIAAIENPDAQIIFKPHPDVLNRHRGMASDPDDVRHLCLVLDMDVPLAQSFETIDHVYTITSQAGLEALMRGIHVTTLGCAFYSGWGLTDDRQINERRQRKLKLIEVFAGAYLLYPKYFDPIYKMPITAEQAVDRLVQLKSIAKPVVSKSMEDTQNNVVQQCPNLDISNGPDIAERATGDSDRRISGSLAPTNGRIGSHNRSMSMARGTRWNHTPAFKAQVALAALKSDKTLAELAQQYDLHPNQITDWKRQLTEHAVQVFGDASSPASSDPDLTKLHAKIGQLTLENDFLEHALTKAGLLSARR